MQETEISFQMKYCRTCATELQSGVHIFGEEGKRLRISEKIRKILSVLVLEEDLLPKRICTECCMNLEEFFQYKESVLDAQEKLKGIAKNLSSPASSSAVTSSKAIVSDEFVCGECGKRLNNAKDLENHRKEHNIEEDSDEPVECEPVQRNDEDLIDVELETSKESHPAPIPTNFPCDFCKEVCTSASLYYKHIAEAHKGSRFSCPFCHISYAQKASLIVHVRTHHTHQSRLPVKKFKCTTCSADFYEKAQLTRHLKSHVEERKFPCYICHKLYKSSKDVSKHVANHLSENKFVCSVCHKGFNRKARLKEHENTHNSENCIGCPFCSKTFTNYPNYLKHLRKMHPEKWKEGEKAPTPIKNTSSSSSTAVIAQSQTQSESAVQSHQSTSSVSVGPSSGSGGWTEPNPVSSSKQNYQNVNSIELVTTTAPLISSDAGNGHAHDPNQPMELCYKLSTSDFQDMPMELTKVFQDSGPLELCVRTAETELSQLIDLTSSNPKDSHHFHSKLDLVDLSNVNVAPFQSQPMDLINRDACGNLSSTNNSVDLSLRSSFSDQSTSSFIRELLDLSARSVSEYSPHDTHNSHHNTPMELNHNHVASKHPQPQLLPYHRVPHSSYMNTYPENIFQSFQN